MSSQDPPDVSGAIAQNNDTLITIGNTSQTNVPATAPPNTNSSEPNNDEINSSVGSQRSLNTRLFPFRFSRDMLLNNVRNWRNTCLLFACYRHKLMTHVLCFCFFQVFQEIRPLVQNTSTANAPFASWMRSSISNVQSEEQRTDSTQTETPRQDVEAGGENVIINFGSPSTSYGRQNSAPARTTTETGSDTMGTPSGNQSRTSLQQQHQSSDSTNSNASNATENDPTAAENGGDSLAQIPEARAFINTISRYFPYICILFAKSCYDHLDGILDIFALFVVFAHSNFTLKQEITKQALRRYLYLIRELIYIVIVVTIIGFILEKKDTFISLFFAPIKFPSDEKTLALKDLLFSVCITDLILKLVTVAIKILFTMLPRRAVEFKNRVSLQNFGTCLTYVWHMLK